MQIARYRHTRLVERARYGSDGLDRVVSQSTHAELDEHHTERVYAGRDPVIVADDVSGDTTVMRDALGEVALRSSTSSGEDRWALLDALGSVVDQADGGVVADISEYSDFGVQTFVSGRWDSGLAFGGELVGANYDSNGCLARVCDPFADGWTQPDQFRGFPDAPETLAPVMITSTCLPRP